MRKISKEKRRELELAKKNEEAEIMRKYNLFVFGRDTQALNIKKGVKNARIK